MMTFNSVSCNDNDIWIEVLKGRVVAKDADIKTQIVNNYTCSKRILGEKSQEIVLKKYSRRYVYPSIYINILSIYLSIYQSINQ